MSALGSFILLATFIVASYALAASVAGGRRRSRALIESGVGAFYLTSAIFVLGVLVQIVAVSGQYAHYVDQVDALTGVPVYQDRFGVPREDIPYGNDPTRWIPELSALRLQAEGLISSQIVDRLGGDGIEVTYAPFEGRSRTVNLSDPALAIPLNFWWYPPPEHRWLVRFLALLLLLAGAAAAFALYRLAWGSYPSATRSATASRL
jgi:hypothetical protein